MKNKILFFILLIPQFALAQLSVDYTAGYGLYNQMGDVKNLLNTKLQTVNEDLPSARIVANFPNYMTHSFGLNYVYHQEEFGFQITYLTTGGKIAYSDFSGKYTNKLTLNGFRIGTRYRHSLMDFLIKQKIKLTLFGEISPGFIVSSLKHKVYDEFPTETLTENNDKDYSSTSFSLLPQVGIKTSFGRFGVVVTAGYDLALAGNLDNGYNTKISWSGIRTGIGFFYTFPPKKEKPKKKDDSD